MHVFLLDELIWNKLIQSFCWMLVHSLWQGLIVTVLCGLVMLLTKKFSSLFRYNIIAFLFFTFLLACACTFILEYQGISQPYNFYNPHLVHSSQPSSMLFHELQRLLVLVTNFCSANARTVVVTWLIFFIIKLGLMIQSLRYGRLLRNNKIHATDSSWTNRLIVLCSILQLRKRVVLLESPIVKIPVVVGYLKPVILLPIGLLAQLPVEQLEAVLLHELAHIRRNDYLVNFLQHIGETIFFFNPALLWISALLREERENCCDDIALHHTKNKKQFLEALLSFKRHAMDASSYATAFPGTGNQLLHRFTRIITNQNKSLNIPEKIFFLVSLLLCSVFFTVLANRDHKKMAVYEKQSTHQSPTAVPLKNDSYHSQEQPDENSFVDKKKNLHLDKKDHSHFVAKSKQPFTKKTIEKLDEGMKKPEDFLNKPDDDNSAFYNEVAKSEEDKMQAMLLKKQAEHDEWQAVKFREQVEKKNQQVTNEAWKSAMDQEQARQAQKKAARDAWEITVKKAQLDKDAAFMKKIME